MSLYCDGCQQPTVHAGLCARCRPRRMRWTLRSRLVGLYHRVQAWRYLRRVAAHQRRMGVRA